MNFRALLSGPKVAPPSVVAKPAPAPIAWPTLTSSWRQALVELCDEHRSVPGATAPVLTSVLEIMGQFGAKQVLPVLLAQNALALLLSAGKTCRNGTYGTVWVDHTDERTYVGAFKMAHPGASAMPQRHGLGAALTKDKTTHADEYTYLGAFRDDVELGMGTRTFVKTGRMTTGERFEMLGDFTCTDRRGDTLAACFASRDGEWLPTGPFVYTYGGKTSVVGQKIDGRYLVSPSLPIASDVSPSDLSATAQTIFSNQGPAALFRWRESNAWLLEQHASHDAGLAPLLSWRANPDHLIMLEQILAIAAHAQADTSPGNRDFLRIMQHLQGPAQAYACQTPGAEKVHLRPWGGDSNQAAFVARTMLFDFLAGRGGRIVEIHLGEGQNHVSHLFHQENYEKPRQMFVGQMEQFLAGMHIAYAADKRAADARLSSCDLVLKELISRGPCADGRVSALIESLTSMHLLTDVAASVPDAVSKNPLELSDAYLMQFRQQALAAYVAAYGGSVADSVAIEGQKNYIAKFFNINLFMHYLSAQEPFAAATPETRAAIRAYQLADIGVLQEAINDAPRRALPPLPV